ncbi:response regulator transcription factor [Conexibacter stalactiti]|uniref:response regulator transcription factor n=1 Tax=Conexibacter stalactiti TaxID=1940611 RepID=UPI00384D5BAA
MTRCSSARRQRVATLLVDGATYPEIAAALIVSRHTVASHIAHILERLDVSTSASQPLGPSTTASCTSAEIPQPDRLSRRARSVATRGAAQGHAPTTSTASNAAPKAGKSLTAASRSSGWTHSRRSQTRSRADADALV